MTAPGFVYHSQPKLISFLNPDTLNTRMDYGSVQKQISIFRPKFRVRSFKMHKAILGRGLRNPFALGQPPPTGLAVWIKIQI